MALNTASVAIVVLLPRWLPLVTVCSSRCIVGVASVALSLVGCCLLVLLNGKLAVGANAMHLFDG